MNSTRYMEKWMKVIALPLVLTLDSKNRWLRLGGVLLLFPWMAIGSPLFLFVATILLLSVVVETALTGDGIYHERNH